jgi:hypothetical protein
VSATLPLLACVAPPGTERYFTLGLTLAGPVLC